MTKKELNLKVFEGKSIPDVLFQPRLEPWFVWHRQFGMLPEKYGEMSLPEFYDELDLSMRYVYGYNTMPDPVQKTYTARVKTKVDQTAETKTTTVNTPYGDLVTKARMTVDSVWRVVEFPVKGPDDFTKLEWLFENTVYSFSRDNFEKGAAFVGDRGEPQFWVPPSPYQALCLELMRFEDFIYAVMDAPEKVERMMRAIENSYDGLYGEIVDFGKVRIINFGENIHAQLTSERYFEKYHIPFYEKRGGQLARAGIYTHIHIDGYFKPLLKYLRHLPFDGLEALTPLPQGDVSIEEIKEHIGDKILLDGIPAVLFTPSFTHEELATCVQKLVELFHPRLILGISDELPQGVDETGIEKVKWIADYCRTRQVGTKNRGTERPMMQPPKERGITTAVLTRHPARIMHGQSASPEQEAATTAAFRQHNEQVSALWEGYALGQPARVPMIIGMNPRVWLLDENLNRTGITFEQYSNDPDTMMFVQAEFQRYHRHHIVQDAPMGMPDGWDVGVDFQNYYEAAWWGAEVQYCAGQVPQTKPFLNLDTRNQLFDRGIPDSVSGIFARGVEYYQYMEEQIGKREYDGIPVQRVGPPPLCTEGPLTLATLLFDPSEFLVLLKMEPQWVQEFLEFLMEGTIQRINGLRQVLGWEKVKPSGMLYDDAIELLSTPDYVQFVLPLHRKYLDTVFGPGLHKIHLCGNVQRHFPTIVRELPVAQIDTGFPLDWKSVRDDVGEDVEIVGGVEISLLTQGDPDRIRLRVKDILESGITRGKRFIFREANSLPPRTSPASVRVMYDAVGEYGTYYG